MQGAGVQMRKDCILPASNSQQSGTGKTSGKKISGFQELWRREGRMGKAQRIFFFWPVKLFRMTLKWWVH